MRALDLESRGLPAQIAGEIGRRITLGELKAGEFLPKELEMLAHLQVSRTTLREALQILSTKGFIEAKPRLGTRVRAPEFWNTLDPVVLSWHNDAKDQEAVIEELFDLRLSIEPLAARLAARRGTPDDHENIAKAYLGMTDTHQSTQAAIEADINFHIQIFQAAHNRFLLPVASVIRAALTISIPKTMQLSGGLESSLKMHQAIADAISERDEAKAADAASALILTTYERNFSR